MDAKLALSWMTLLVLTAAPAAAAQDRTSRISSTPSGAPGDDDSGQSVISADGEWIAFVSDASDLVAGDTNQFRDVFLCEVATGAITRVSVASDGSEADDYSQAPRLSADGSVIAFMSYALNLTDDALPFGTQVYIHDRTTGVTELVSRSTSGEPADGASGYPSISADGNLIAFESGGRNLGSDQNGRADIFLRDRAAGTTQLVSVNADGSKGNKHSMRPWICADGTVVEFVSTCTNFPDACADLIAYQAVYVKEIATGVLERVDSGGGFDGCGVSFAAGLSADGSQALFTSFGVFNYYFEDVYLRDRLAGTTTLVSLGTGGTPIDDASVYGASMSPDARFVLFQTSSNEVTPDDHDDNADIYVRDLVLDVTTRASIGTYDETSALGAAGGAISDDGRRIVFDSGASEFTSDDTLGHVDVFLRDRCLAAAIWVHYDVGFPGRGGTIPTLTPRANPWRGTTLEIDVTNSSALYTVAFVFVGVARASIPTRLGGTLLVDPLLVLPLPLTPAGGLLAGELPDDWWACGLAIDLQALELDPFAQEGVSFTEGLELVLGDT